jgi:hypothetical protein
VVPVQLVDGAAATETLTATNRVERLTEGEGRDVGFDVCMSHPSTSVRVKRSKMVLCGDSTLWRGLVQVEFASLDNEVFARDGNPSGITLKRRALFCTIMMPDIADSQAI